MINLTFPPWWLYAVSIAAKTAIWFSSQEEKRITTLRDIFMSVHMASPVSFGRVVWGALRSLVLVSSLPTLSTPPTSLLRGRDSQTEKEDLNHDNT